MDRSKDLTDKELLAMGKKSKVIKRILFKDYTATFINLGLTSKDSKMMKKELPAIVKRGAELVIKDMLDKTKMPTDLPKHQQPFVTIVIYAGVVDRLDGKETFIYPNATDDSRLEEV